MSVLSSLRSFASNHSPFSFSTSYLVNYLGAIHKVCMLKIGTIWTPSPLACFSYRENGDFYIGCSLLVSPPPPPPPPPTS